MNIVDEFRRGFANWIKTKEDETRKTQAMINEQREEIRRTRRRLGHHNKDQLSHMLQLYTFNELWKNRHIFEGSWCRIIYNIIVNGFNIFK